MAHAFGAKAGNNAKRRLAARDKLVKMVPAEEKEPLERLLNDIRGEAETYYEDGLAVFKVVEEIHVNYLKDLSPVNQDLKRIGKPWQWNLSCPICEEAMWLSATTTWDQIISHYCSFSHLNIMDGLLKAETLSSSSLTAAIKKHPKTAKGYNDKGCVIKKDNPDTLNEQEKKKSREMADLNKRGVFPNGFGIGEYFKEIPEERKIMRKKAQEERNAGKNETWNEDLENLFPSLTSEV